MNDLATFVQEMKAKQDQQAQLEAELLQHASKVWQGLVDRLEKFIAAGQAAGLKGLTPCEQSRYEDGVQEMRCVLDHVRLVFIMPPRVSGEESKGGNAAAKIWIYINRAEEEPATGEVVIWQPSDKPPYCELALFGTEGRRGREEYQTWADEGVGRRIANRLVEQIYSRRKTWAPRLPLLAWRTGDVQRQEIGFLANLYR